MTWWREEVLEPPDHHVKPLEAAPSRADYLPVELVLAKNACADGKGQGLIWASRHTSGEQPTPIKLSQVSSETQPLQSSVGIENRTLRTGVRRGSVVVGVGPAPAEQGFEDGPFLAQSRFRRNSRLNQRGPDTQESGNLGGCSDVCMA